VGVADVASLLVSAGVVGGPGFERMLGVRMILDILLADARTLEYEFSDSFRRVRK
jgi:hypothetical protein